jgi:hypothetical protein
MENRFAHDFSRVRIHADRQAADAAKAVDADAFTVGNHIVFSSGSYQPMQSAGRTLLTHEMIHVLQHGSVANVIPSSVAPSDSIHEREAASIARSNGNNTAIPYVTANVSTPTLLRQDDTKNEKQKSPKMLLADVLKTPLGQELVSELAGDVPKVVWGSASQRASYDGEKITLNESYKDSLNETQWKQIIAMELGNAVNEAKIQQVRDSADADPPPRESYVEAIERIEFDSRLRVVQAIKAGQFGVSDTGDAFDTGVTDFEAYIRDERGAAHREEIGADWDTYYKDKYLKRQPSRK